MAKEVATKKIEVDDTLVQEALRFGKGASEREVLEQALRDYIAYHKRLDIIELFGTIDYDDDYDYKEQRKKK